ncbi:HYC_CC_PP family protein [Psychroflexus maritimus]|uniref:Secreted protein n=1 Tax=Psychroflexus maritimus TaxID=2714865 RepID=A0A967AFG8_9FLAO|nr:hypothetical protein [Psychroflexus maritimus]NGZ90593.1 hypothetical protein [Psychroflexus maritimus]
MKFCFQHITSLLLALLVLVSTQSYSVNSHYCSNILVDKAIMKPAKKCEMHGEKTHSEQKHEHKKDECCDDEVELIKGQDQLKIQSSDFELPLPIFVEAFVFTFFSTTYFETEVNTTIYEDPPPLLQRDFQTLYQVFLI